MKRFRSLFALAAEIFLAILLVLTCHIVFLQIMNALFPTGPTLQELMDRKGRTGQSDQTSKSSRHLLITYGDNESDLFDSQSLAATLSKTHNNVKTKRADSIAWSSARQGMALFDRDAVQTFKRSNALIQFDDNNYIDMGENSLVIIKRLEQDFLFRERRSLLVIVDGELRGRIAETDRKAIHVEVTTPSAVARIKTRKALKGQADFKITVNPDKSSTIAVFEGTAEVMAQGVKVELTKNHATNVPLGQVPAVPEALPEPVTLISPAEAASFTYRNLPPRVRFTWAPLAATVGYKFELARDPHFREMVHKEHLTGTGFTHGNLKEGDYFWKVTSREQAAQGAVAETRSFQIVRDLQPPHLTVAFPSETTHEKRYHVTGKAEPGARVYVLGHRVSTSDKGKFHYSTDLQPGINIIIVEAVDRAGNVTYQSKLVSAKD